MPGGRPAIVTPQTIQKLEQAFALGCSDTEACFYSNIGKSTLYNYQNDNPDFLERKELLKEKPVLLARKSVIKFMQNDGNLALKYLERKKKDEFSTKTIEEKALSPELMETIISALPDADIRAIFLAAISPGQRQIEDKSELEQTEDK